MWLPAATGDDGRARGFHRQNHHDHHHSPILNLKKKLREKKIYLIQIAGKGIKKEMKVVVNLEYLKMEKFLTKLELIFLKSMENYQNNLRTRFLELTRVQNFGPQASRL